MSYPQVAIIGGGIIGLSSALCALETVPGIDVTVISAEFSPNTTGDGSAGFWNPYLLGDVPLETMRFWCSETFNYLQNICFSPEGGKCGVGLLSAFALSRNPIEYPPYKDIFLECRDASPKELKAFPGEYRYGIYFTTLFAECAKLLPCMMNKFTAKGGKIIRRRINDLSELIGSYDVVVNCPGVEAAYLVHDSDVKPIRGQVIRVKAPWIKHAIVAIDDDLHILPNSELVVCGGTHQEGSWNKQLNPEDRQRIWEGCCALCPSLKNAEIVKEWVGLRPGRSKPRLERETLVGEKGVKLEVVHNYGHGGSGVTLFWGCAKDAAKLLEQAVNAVKERRLSSKL